MTRPPRPAARPRHHRPALEGPPGRRRGRRRGWHDDPDTLPLLRDRATTDRHEDVRPAAVEAVATGWHDDPDTLPLLRDRATTDPSENARQTAIEAIAVGHHDP